MAVRNTNQFVAPSGNDGGLILLPESDLKCFGSGSNLQWAIDSNGASGRQFLWAGDTNTGFPRSRSGVSLPFVPAGSLGGFNRVPTVGAFTVTVDDFFLMCDTSGGDVTLNLPPVAGATNMILFIKNLGVNKVIIDPNASELIDGDSQKVLDRQYDWAIIYSNGFQWCVWGFVAQYEWHKFTVTHTQLQAAALSNDIEIASLAPGEIIHGVKLKHSALFTGPAITNYFLSLGFAGGLQDLLIEYDVKTTAVGDTNFAVAHTFDTRNHAAAVSVRIAARSVGANLSTSTGGSVDVWLHTQAAV